MVDDNKNLSSVYGAEDADATRTAYEGWAEGYDAENLGNGYRVPGIGTAMIARHVLRKRDQSMMQHVELELSGAC